MKKLISILNLSKSYIKRKKKFIPLVVAILALPITLLLISQVQDLRNRAADDTPSLLDDNISEDSTVEKLPKVSRFSINSFDKSMYTLRAPDENGVQEMLSKSPKTSKRSKRIPGQSAEKILPSNFKEKSFLKTKREETRDEKGNQLSHYRYGQKIKDIPIFNAELSVHVRNRSDVYSMDGNLVTDESVPSPLLSEKDAQAKAMSKAMADNPFNQNAQITMSEKVIFNGKAIGISENDNNRIAQKITVTGPEESSFAHMYIVDMVNGEILYEENLVQSIKRETNDCSGRSCILTGSETKPPTSGDSLNAFNNFGTIYNHYLSTYNRNGYGNNDDLMKSYVNVSSHEKNAAWYGTEKVFRFGSGMATLDITAHEFTHAVTQSTANLAYSYQSGAINEAISDMFGSSVDNNWTIGEGSTTSILRDMSNPPSYSQPDRMFSGYYSCSSSDNGGVHVNSGVANKAYYLMVSGGNFNNCNVSGIGRTNANKIIYRALTVYLTASANFYSLYGAITNSCNDLFGAASSTCTEVKKALQAVEIDQQPISYTSGASCLGVTPLKPQCATTNNPTPTIANPTPTPSYIAATIKSPVPGSTLSGSSVTFTWNPPYGAISYYVYLGTTGAGSTDVFTSSATTTPSVTVTTIPTTSSTLYLRLWTYFNSTGWKYNDYTYKTGSTASLTPTPTGVVGSSPTMCDGGLTNCANATASNYSCSGTKGYVGNASKDTWCKTNGGAGSREYCWRCAAPTPTPTSSTSCTTTCYRDADGDGYGMSTSYLVNQCTCSAGYSTLKNDCYDSNANARPNQAGYFGVHRGDGSFDYNCNGTTDKKYPKNSFGTAATATCFASPPSGTVNFTNDTACGVSGSFRLCFRWATTACGGTSTANASSQSTGQSCPGYVAGNGWALTDGGSVQQQCK